MFASTVIGPVSYSAQAPGPAQPSVRDEPTRALGEADKSDSANAAGEEAADGKVAKADTAQKPNGETLSEQELQQLEQMKTTDRDVRQHELAHQIAGGQYTGAASFQYERGPDGKRYAVAGEVPVDYGPVPGDPRATIGKMQQVISAALAPADPSPKDHQVAAQARQYLLTAQLELSRQASELHASQRPPLNSGARAEETTAESSAPQNTANRNTLDASPSLSQYDVIARAVQSQGGSARLSNTA
ncbi:putative metalloprotease CJM1_0395 family protein [Billgrantia sp. LNSP4103-1]|uniref:putative metalloprotease CJM1_0395 family protein n=1 Tax=Billgrantia sp. LNSP4103-1 TaxID=3410266 RepID=UPI00403F1FAA